MIHVNIVNLIALHRTSGLMNGFQMNGRVVDPQKQSIVVELLLMKKTQARLQQRCVSILYFSVIKKVSTGCLKKMSFLGKIAITTLKLIQNANVGGVLENSGYLLPHGH